MDKGNGLHWVASSLEIPRIHLLDEPLSNLDANLRTPCGCQLAELHQEYQKTTLFVTHDQVEAMTLGQRLCVMNQGKSSKLELHQKFIDQPAIALWRNFLDPHHQLFRREYSDYKKSVFYELATKIPFSPKVQSIQMEGLTWCSP